LKKIKKAGGVLSVPVRGGGGSQSKSKKEGIEMANRIRVFTIREGKVTKGALVEKFSLKGAGMEIPAILVGEDGRGRKLGVLPVHLLPHQKEVWEEKGEVIVNFAS